MYRFLALALLVVITTGPAVSANDPPAGKPSDPLAGITGEWVVTTYVVGGQTQIQNGVTPIPDGTAPAVRASIEAQRRTRHLLLVDARVFKLVMGASGTDFVGLYKIDTTQTTNHLDIETGTVIDRGFCKAICSVSGDTLQVCFAGAGGERPAKFESPSGSGVILITCTRMAVPGEGPSASPNPTVNLNRGVPPPAGGRDRRDPAVAHNLWDDGKKAEAVKEYRLLLTRHVNHLHKEAEGGKRSVTADILKPFTDAAAGQQSLDKDDVEKIVLRVFESSVVGGVRFCLLKPVGCGAAGGSGESWRVAR
ncbi:MAG: hypothetical protein K2X82_24280, partial [Gemmataceae bacterium]|nr:hypothetical protein [Gemmataceae bacterium]